MEDSIEEVVPGVAKVAGKLSQASVITARRRIRLTPQSGQNYTVGAGGGANTVNILIQDGQSYADLLSAVLSFEVTTTATGGNCALDDGAYSVFRRALVSVNSTLMDDVDFLAKKANAEIYSTVSQSWYDNVGSFMGLWKANTSAYATNDTRTAGPPASIGFIDKYDVADKLNIAKEVYAVSATAPNRHKFMVPVSMLSSFFRNETLMPLRNAGQLYLQLNLASATEACVCPAGVSAPTYAISNLTLEMDFVDLHPQYIALMDEIMERPDAEGVRWAFDAHLVSAQNIGGGNGQQSVIISKASQNMRSIQVITQPTAGLSAVTYPKQSTFCNPGFVDIQYRVGSLYFPAFASIGEHRAFADLQSAFGRVASVDKAGVIDIQNYYNATATAGTMGVAYPYNGGLAPGGSVYQAYSDMWTHAYCFDKLKSAVFGKGGAPDLDGINTLSSSGSQIVVQLNANIASASVNEPLTLTGIVRFTRVLEIRGGATRVIG